MRKGFIESIEKGGVFPFLGFPAAFLYFLLKESLNNSGGIFSFFLSFSFFLFFFFSLIIRQVMSETA
ncbi:hypothetical protein J3F84DRAFT_362234 [Trichoderma pleuroticola]